MLAAKPTRQLFWIAEGLLLFSAVAAAAWLSRSSEWHPLALVGLLLTLALVGQWLNLSIRGQELTGAFIALVLAMSLLGPTPAVAFGIAAMVLASSTRRLSPALWLNNLSAFAVFPLVGGVMVRWLVGDVHDPRNHHLTQSVTFALVVFAVFMVTNGLNFALIALDIRVTEGRSLYGQARDLFVPMLPGQIATGALATMLAVAYTNLGLPVLFGSILVLVIFQYLMRALLRSEDRADQLEARSHASGIAAARRAYDLGGDPRPARPHDRAPRRRSRPLRSRTGARGGLRRGRAGPRPHRRAAPRHRQVRAARPHPARRGPLRRGLGGDPPPPAGRGDARGQARRLRPGGRRDPLPPRARRRQRLSGGADRQRDPARVAHPGDLLDLRHAHRARHLPLADDAPGRDDRAAPRRRAPVRQRAGRELHRDARARRAR